MSTVVPVETPETEYLWEGFRCGEIRLQQCAECGSLRFLPAYHCSVCGSPGTVVRVAAGTGNVYSYAITHRPNGLPVVDEYPVIALVELDEGVRLVSNVTGVALDDVRVGLRVQAYFEPASADTALVRFAPVRAS